MKLEKGRDFKLCRKSKDIMQDKVAEYLNVSQTLISLFETDKKNMNKNTVAKYKEFLENYIVK